jgi:hypothetical protein
MMDEDQEADNNADFKQKRSLIDLVVAPSENLEIGKQYCDCLTIKVEFDKENILIIFPLIGDGKTVSMKEFLRYIDEKSGLSFQELFKSTIGKNHVDSYISKVYEVVDFVASFSFPLVKDMINFDDVVDNYHVLYPYVSFLIDRGFLKNGELPGVYPGTISISA